VFYLDRDIVKVDFVPKAYGTQHGAMSEIALFIDDPIRRRAVLLGGSCRRSVFRYTRSPISIAAPVFCACVLDEQEAEALIAEIARACVEHNQSHEGSRPVASIVVECAVSLRQFGQQSGFTIIDVQNAPRSCSIETLIHA